MVSFSLEKRNFPQVEKLRFQTFGLISFLDFRSKLEVNKVAVC